MNSVTAVIVHYGDHEPTVDLATSVSAFGASTIVVANDGSPRPNQLPPAVEWIVPDRNLGYGEAFAHGTRGRDTDVYVVMNTDVVISQATFTRCVEVLLNEPGAGVVGPVLYHEDGQLQSGAAELTRWRKAARARVEPGRRVVDTLWVTGAIMFVRREVFKEVGVDGSFFLGCEDADLCLRVHQAGWRVICVGDAPATHHGSRVITGPRWAYYSVRNGVWFARAHFGLFRAIINWLYAAVHLPRVLVADAFKRRDFLSSRLSLLGLAHALRTKPSAADGPLPDEPIPARVMRW